jgi:hypothetical protein
MSESRLVDITGRERSPAATPGRWAGYAPPNKGRRYPADPPTVEEIILMMRQAGPGPYADRVRGLIAILWRAGLRISEALALTETDLDPPGRCWSAPARAGSAGWLGWMTGVGSTSPDGLSTGSNCRLARCSASSPAPPAAAGGQRPPLAASSAVSPPRPGCGAGSPRTSCGTPTRSRWRTRGSRCPSSSASSGIMRVIVSSGGRALGSQDAGTASVSLADQSVRGSRCMICRPTRTPSMARSMLSISEPSGSKRQLSVQRTGSRRGKPGAATSMV